MSERKAAVAARLHIRRGLSEAEAALYVGLGVTKFAALVQDGRMPRPRLIDTRRIWDIDDLDAAFKELPVEGEPVLNSWDDLISPDNVPGVMPHPGRSTEQEQQLHETYMQALGYDPRGMTEEEKTAAETKRIANWTAAVRASPLWKKEKFALLELLKDRGEWMSGMHIKGASMGTFERLDARGYVLMKMAPWHYADTGKLAPREGEHWQLTPDGEAAAGRL